MVSFDHRDPGTDESVWVEALRRDLPPLDLDVDHLIVVAAHPDDESLGAAGLLATAAARGIPVDLLVVTDGEGSHPDSPTHGPATLALMRRRELYEAARIVGLVGEPIFLGLPDGGTEEYRDAVSAALRETLDAAAGRRVLVLSPWRGDGHRDHRVVGEIVEQVCAARGVRSRAFPIWLWHWGGPDDVPWDRVERLVLEPRAREAKTRALDAHRSQLEPLSRAPGDEAMIHAGMRAHAERDAEFFVVPERPAAPAASVGREYFDDMYARHDDPWGFDSRWYEERKRAVLLSALPRRRYRSTLEAGCSTGALTAQLTDRSDRVLAVDLAPAALERARTRLAGHDNVELRLATLPGAWPEGEFDLVVLSEVAYYWAGVDLDRGLTAAAASLSVDGHLVACHWRHPVAEYPLSGDQVHDALAARGDLVRLVRHDEEDFVLEVYAHPGVRSVAAESGLVP